MNEYVEKRLEEMENDLLAFWRWRVYRVLKDRYIRLLILGYEE